MSVSTTLTPAEAERLAARVAELEHERKHLLAVIEILKDISGSLHFVDILQAIARKLGEAFGLDRCSIFLTERDRLQDVHEVQRSGEDRKSTRLNSSHRCMP